MKYRVVERRGLFKAQIWKSMWEDITELGEYNFDLEGALKDIEKDKCNKELWVTVKVVDDEDG